MKKIATLIIGWCLFATNSFAQLAQGATAPNFTLTDLNGTSWDLYTVLAQGKTVVIDISATWCGPCFSYHNSHALENFYAHYGPNGTTSPGKAMVFFIEGDASTTVADLNGTGTNTQGNWVSGTPYPIFNPSNPQCSQINTGYAIAYFPTLYVICSDKKVYELSQPTEAQIVAKMNAVCPSAIYNLDATTSLFQNTIICSSSFSPVVTLQNGGQTTLSSCSISYKIDNGTPQNYSWTGSIAAGQTGNATLSPITVSTSGSHTLTVTTSAPNGGTDQNTGNDTQSYPFVANITAGSAIPLTETFSASTFPSAGWTLNNPDGATTWERNTTVGGFGTSTSCMFYDAYNYNGAGQFDEIIIPAVDLSVVSSPVLEFDLAHAPYSTVYVEQLEVFISTDCATTWTSVYNKSGATLGTAPACTTKFTPTASQWRKESINLNTYIGQNKVFVKFKVTNGYGNEVYVDNINVKGTSTSGINNNIIDNTLNIYPNPAKEFINIAFESDQVRSSIINLYNALGEIMQTTILQNNTSGSQKLKLETNNLPAGLYVVEIKTGNYTCSRKIMID